MDASTFYGFLFADDNNQLFYDVILILFFYVILIALKFSQKTLEII